MLLSTIVFTLFAIALGWAIWWTWRQREAARKHAELAEKQAATNAELAVLGERVRAVAHDVDNLFAILLSNLSSADALPPEELREMLSDVQRATSSASRMIRAIRNAKVGPGGERSVEPIVQLVAALLARGEVPIEVEHKGMLTYVGSEEDALRVVQNLVVNATREAKSIDGARVRIVIEEGSLRVTNPTNKSAALFGEAIYEDGVSGNASSGLGLGIVKQRAEAIGWGVQHRVALGEVCFSVTRKESRSS
jgi:signal transduction histidine kinase